MLGSRLRAAVSALLYIRHVSKEHTVLISCKRNNHMTEHMLTFPMVLRKFEARQACLKKPVPIRNCCSVVYSCAQAQDMPLSHTSVMTTMSDKSSSASKVCRREPLDKTQLLQECIQYYKQDKTVQMQHISVALTQKVQSALGCINALHQHARPLTEDQNDRMKC